MPIQIDDETNGRIPGETFDQSSSSKPADKRTMALITIRDVSIGFRGPDLLFHKGRAGQLGPLKDFLFPTFWNSNEGADIAFSPPKV
ncbi:MAG: hypothetical protein AAF497_15410, partial [Planctomycetota bacterium]